MSQEKNRHDGHKSRLREKFEINHDFSGFKDHEILEVMLNYAQVRKNMNNVAHDLINKFGSFDAVFEADKEELMKVDGIGNFTASFLMMQRQFFSIYEQKKHDITKKGKKDTNFMAYLCSLFAGVDKEQIHMFCVKESGRITESTLIGRGKDDSVFLDLRQAIKIALNCNARGVIFAHNHLTGNATPSNDDVVSTRKIKNSLESVDIKLIDHYVVAGNQCSSIIEDSRFRLLK